MAPPNTVRSAQPDNSVRAKSKPQQQKKPPPQPPQPPSSLASTSTSTPTELDPTRKTVFRPVLDSPLTINWPPIPAPIRKQLLEALLSFLSTPTSPDELPIAEWRLQEHARKRGRIHGAGKKTKKKRREEREDGGAKTGSKRPRGVDEEEGEKGRKRVKLAVGDGKEGEQTSPKKTHEVSTRSNKTYHLLDYVDKESKKPKEEEEEKEEREPLPRPKLLDQITVGINEVTKGLESRIRWARWEMGDESAAPPTKVVGEEVGVGGKGNNRRKLRKNGGKDDKSSTTTTKKKLPPFDPTNPTSSLTLSRPSYRFLTQPIPKPSTTLPPYLLPPTEPTPFFRLLVNSTNARVKARDATFPVPTLMKRDAGKEGKGSAEVALGDLMCWDDSRGSRTVRVGKKGKDVTDGGIYGDESETEGGGVFAAGGGGEGVENVPDGIEAKTTTGGEEKDDTTTSWIPLIDLIFVCKPDINPPSLVAHLPTTVAAANGAQQALDEAQKDGIEQETTTTNRPKSSSVYLIPLDIGAEQKLADVLALRRVAAIGLSSTTPNITPLLTLIQTHLQPLTASFLTPHIANPLPSSSSSSSSTTLIPTHIKHLRTTAPLNPKAASTVKKEIKKGKKDERKRKRDGRMGEEVYVAEDE